MNVLQLCWICPERIPAMVQAWRHGAEVVQ